MILLSWGIISHQVVQTDLNKTIPLSKQFTSSPTLFVYKQKTEGEKTGTAQTACKLYYCHTEISCA